MKKLIFWIFLLNILILNQTNILLASELMPGNEYLEKHQWGALEDILTDWKTGKLNTNECVIYGCYVLAAQEPARTDKIEKAKLLPSKYKLNKQSIEEGPYFFIYQIYQNENSLNKNALNEFRHSEWSDYDFIEDFTNNEKFIKIILETPLESYNNDEYRDYYNICVKALQNKVIMPQTIKYIHWLAHSGVNIKRYKNKITPFDKNYKLSLMGIPSSGFLTSLFSEFPDATKFQIDEDRLLKDRKLINTVNYLIYSRYKIGGLPTIYKEGFKVIGIGVDEKIVEQYCDWLVKYKNKMVSYGLKEPVNFQGGVKSTLEITLLNDYCPEQGCQDYYASTNVASNLIVTKCNLEFFIKKINDDIKVTPPEKHAIHELMHSISYSYDSKENSLNDYHWYIFNKNNDRTDCVRLFEESLASWAEDSFYEGNDPFYIKKLSTIYKSAAYFFEDYRSNNYTFPAKGMFAGKKYYYSYSYFFKFLCDQTNNKVIKTLWENVATNRFTVSFKTIIEKNNKNVSEIFHDFALRNYYINKVEGSYPDEDIFKTANDVWNNAGIKFPVLEIKDTWLPNIITAEKKIPPYGTKIYKLSPPDTTLYNG